MSVISWDNYVDDATILNSSAVTSPLTSSEVLSVQNLKTRQVGDIFRQNFLIAGSPLPSLIIDFDLGSSKLTDLIAIINHNMQSLAYTIDFGTTSGASDVGTETGTFWQGTADDPLWEVLYLASGHTARYVRITVTITATGTYDIGRVWFDEAWSTNVSMDFSLAVVDRSTKSKSRGGSTYASARQILRQLHIRAFGLKDADFMGTSSDFDSFLSMDLAVGTHGEMILLPLTDTQINRQRLGVYGTIANNQPIRVLDKGSAGYLTEKRFTVEEDR